VADRRALPRLRHYYEPSDSSKRRRSAFPTGGYSVAYPSPTIRRPGHGPALVAPACVGCENCRDPARSPWITSSTISPRPAGITCRSPCAWVVPVMRAGFTGRTGGTGSLVSPCVGGSPPRPAFCRFTARSSLRLRLRPLRTLGHPNALGFSYRTSTTKAREGLPPPCWRGCQAYDANLGRHHVGPGRHVP